MLYYMASVRDACKDYGVFTPEQENDGHGVKGIIGMHRFNIESYISGVRYSQEKENRSRCEIKTVAKFLLINITYKQSSTYRI